MSVDFVIKNGTKYSSITIGMFMFAAKHPEALSEFTVMREMFHLVKYQKDG
ncbi:hypothetical protein SAMN02745220_01712 [Desulfopila aestuarii DSM 18488]|uniref:Uncharacterized protein n=1 Tax=Desulfopila aestuarii DSM 18488 TaxID=1121416 RepID=A0A1M7Y4E6_9BACT|nr:hypothetical protein SAMN02745220_01712 [Desulfopila aestuarii DSM 18488]